MPANPTDKPFVSVIIPTYNLAHYIVETVESILMQSYGNIEILVIDDGSQDNTRDVLQPYLSQITYMYQENQGISRTYNRGIELAKGNYICFLEADDYWITADKVEKQVAIIQQDSSIDYVLTGWQEVDATGSTILAEVRLWENAPELTVHDWFF